MSTVLRAIGLISLVLFSIVSQGQTVDTVLLRQKGVNYHVQYNNGSTYQWGIDGGTIVSGNGTNEITVDWGILSGSYFVWVIEKNSFGCFGDTIFQEVFVQPHEFPVIVGKSKICRGEIVELTVTGEDSSFHNISYIWSTGDTGKSIFVMPVQTTTYTVVVEYNGDVIDSAFYTVEVITSLGVGFTWTPQFPQVNEPVVFNTIGSSGQQHIYQWYFNGTRSPFLLPNISQSFDSVGYVTVQLVVYNQMGCTDTIEQKIYIRSEKPFLVPDAFSPNGDGRNDQFVVDVPEQYSNIKCRIFNRWGAQVFSSSEHKIVWDGNYNGILSTEGAYVVMIEAVNEMGKWVKYDGTISILR
jgi:gliding motility-associated-like protein